MSHRNLWGDITLATSGLATLLARTPLTTICGAGFTTVQSLVVQPAPPATDDPPRYVDGKPVDTQTTGDGDGTVLLRSARIDDPRVRNLPSVPVVHDQLPDKAVAQLMTDLGITPPAAIEAPAPAPKLVIMTASPVELTVDLPSMAPAVLGAEQAPTKQRQRRVRGTNYGHKGKHLNMAVITQPAIGTYNIHLRGTGAGSFALGALIVGVQSTAVLSADPTNNQVRSPAVTPISTAGGQVAAQTELLYQVACVSYTAPPQVRFDAVATSRNALARLSTAAIAPAPVVLGDEEPIPQVVAVLSAADAPESLRTTVRAALVDGDQQAMTELITLVSRADVTSMGLLIDITQQVVGAKDRALALGLLEQLRQIAELRA